MTEKPLLKIMNEDEPREAEVERRGLNDQKKLVLKVGFWLLTIFTIVLALCTADLIQNKFWQCRFIGF